MEDKCLPLRRNIVTGLFLKNITSQVSSIKIYILMRSVQILPITRISMVGAMILISSEIQCFFLRKSAERVWNTLLFKKLHKKKSGTYKLRSTVSDVCQLVGSQGVCFMLISCIPVCQPHGKRNVSVASKGLCFMCIIQRHDQKSNFAPFTPTKIQRHNSPSNF